MISNRKIIVSVISDLVTDQRVMKECNTLYAMGFNIILIGRRSNNSSGLENRPYKIVRFRNIFKKGKGMYLIFNIQLFFYLLFHPAQILWSNDLDTLLPNYLVSIIYRSKLIYDSHEYFTMSVIKISSRVIWQKLENFLFPKLKNVITVNNSIKNVYEKKYLVPVIVIRNVPYKTNIEPSCYIYEEEKILIIQGVGINENRGAEEAIEMMKYLPERFKLYFIGRGTVVPKLKEKVKNEKLANKVIFIDPLPYDKMMEYTRRSFLGLIFEKIDETEEHKFALPNRFFDYIKAGIPTCSTNAVEITKIIRKNNIGLIVNSLEPIYLANKILEVEKNKELYSRWRENNINASEEFCWENEEKKLIHFMNHLQ